MLNLALENVEEELRSYCQKWLGFLSQRQFDEAEKLISSPNSYGTRWGRREIEEAVVDYFGEEVGLDVQNVPIATCSPEFLKCNDGSYLYGFYFPVNGEITDLTVEFEFNLVKAREFSATINDIHVL